MTRKLSDLTRLGSRDWVMIFAGAIFGELLGFFARLLWVVNR